MGSVPETVTGLQDIIKDAARLSAAYGDLTEAWNRESGDDPERRGWLGFCVLSAYVAAYADPAQPPDEQALAHLDAVFREAEVRRVILRYYTAAGDGGEGRPGPVAHRADEDLRPIRALRDRRETAGLVPPSDDPWTWRLHRVGTSALVLAATPPPGRDRQPVAVKLIAPPYLEWNDIRAANAESGELSGLRCKDALPEVYASTEAALVSEFVAGDTLAEVFAARDGARRAAGRRRYRVDDGVRFALAHWLPVVRALAELAAAAGRAGQRPGHGDLNPSNIIFRGHRPSRELPGDAAALGLVAAVRSGVRRRDDPGPPRALEVRFVDLGPSHLLQRSLGLGRQSVSHFARYTAPELLGSGTGDADREKADLYSLGDLLLDALVPGSEEDGERLERVYRYSFELGQLVDSLRSSDPDHRTVVHGATDRGFDWRAFAGDVEGILEAARDLGGSGLKAFSALGLPVFSPLHRLVPGLAPSVDIQALRTGTGKRVATLGSREPATIRWFRLSQLTATLFAALIIMGVQAATPVGCDFPLGSDLCPLEGAVETITRPSAVADAGAGMADQRLVRLTILAAAITWLFAAHLYYLRIFAQLRPSLCRGVPWGRASEVAMRVVASPGYLVFFLALVVPGAWWLWSGAGSLLAAANNWLFTQFLRGAVARLRASAPDGSERDSLAATANRVESFLDREYRSWWVLMAGYGVGCLLLGGWVLLAEHALTGDVGARAMVFVELPLVLGIVAVNLTMLYRNCSEIGDKAPEVRANGARAIAGCLRLDAIEDAAR